MAYADGELDADMRAQIAEAIKTDSSLAQRVQAHQARRSQLSGAFASVLDEPVPDRLLAMLKTDTRGDAVVDLAQARAKKADANVAAKKPAFNWLAVAASLLVGVLIGALAMNSRDSTQGAGNVVASNSLSEALSSQLASESNSTVRMGLSYRSKSGDYCRSFVNEANAGIACRHDDTWQVQMLVPAEKSDDATYRPAASAIPKAILDKVDQDIDGEALDSEAESAAIKQQWKETRK